MINKAQEIIYHDQQLTSPNSAREKVSIDLAMAAFFKVALADAVAATGRYPLKRVAEVLGVSR